MTAPAPLPRLDPGRLQLSVAAGAHPEQAAHVRTEGFEGPLGLLLSLIEERRLDILSVPLGELAGAYLEAIATMEEDQLPHISAFVTIASQLILIKSRALLPRVPQPAAPGDAGADPEEALRARLVEYRRYRDAAASLAALAAAGGAAFHREAAVALAAASVAAVAPPPRRMDPATLVTALARWVQIALPLEEAPVVVPRTVTLADRARVIRDALRGAPAIVLQELLEGVRDRVVVAVTFMAMLELVKGRELVVEQSEPWGPISVRRAEPTAARAAALAGDAHASDEAHASDLADA
ncbi:MAG: ScpA family protein [Chloroflexota bacterium]